MEWVLTFAKDIQIFYVGMSLMKEDFHLMYFFSWLTLKKKNKSC